MALSTHGAALPASQNLSPYRVLLVLFLFGLTFLLLLGVSGTARTKEQGDPKQVLIHPQSERLAKFLSGSLK